MPVLRGNCNVKGNGILRCFTTLIEEDYTDISVQLGSIAWTRVENYEKLDPELNGEVFDWPEIPGGDE